MMHMRKTLFFTILTICSIMANAQTKIYLTIGENTMSASLVDNISTRNLISLLEQGPISINMSDYGGFEKVGSLPQMLPTSNSQISTVPGDIMLYQGNQIVIFYGNNSWSYTRLGKIDNATTTSVKEFLGVGNITLTLSLSSMSGIKEITPDINSNCKAYDLQGRMVTTRPLPPGIYIVNGKKVFIV